MKKDMQTPKNVTFKILADGTLVSLYEDDSELLRGLGTMQVVRASNVRFDPGTQKWFVELKLPGNVIYCMAQDYEKRSDAIEYEKTILNKMLPNQPFEKLFDNS